MTVETGKIFCSYAREDADFALRLAKDMKSAGANIWLDQLDISIGQRWDRAVEEALRVCERLLVVLSPVSVESHNVMDEVSFALEEKKQILPVLCRTCEIPFRLRRVQYIDFTVGYDSGLLQLHKALNLEEPIVALTNSPAASPSPSLDSAAFPQPSATPQVSSPTSQAATSIPVLLWLCILPYAVFTIVLLYSSSDSDEQAGRLFLGNAVLLTAGGVLTLLRRVPAWSIAASGACAQCVILLVMLGGSIGEAWITVPTNLAIAAVYAGLAVYYRNLAGEQSDVRSG